MLKKSLFNDNQQVKKPKKQLESKSEALAKIFKNFKGVQCFISY